MRDEKTREDKQIKYTKKKIRSSNRQDIRGCRQNRKISKVEGIIGKEKEVRNILINGRTEKGLEEEEMTIIERQEREVAEV